MLHLAKRMKHTSLALECIALTAAALLQTGFMLVDERDEAPPPPPRFIAHPGAMLATDFHAGFGGWVPDKRGVWSIAHGALCANLPDKRQQRSFIYAGLPTWTDYAVDLDVCQTRGVDKGVAVRVDKGHGIGVDLRGPGYHDVLLHRQEWPMGRVPIHNDNFVWHHIRIEARGETFRVFVNGKLMLEKEDGHHSSPRGRIALAAYTGGDGHCTVYYSNVIVTSLSK